MKPKIGILTFHRAYNYGAVLQAYALQEAIRNSGANPEIIDYQSVFMTPRFKKEHLPASFMDGYFHFITSHDCLSKKTFSNFEELRNEHFDYDLIFVGSDQVWNTEITNSDPVFFLEFVSENTETASYAASFGTPGICLEHRQRFKKMFQKMKAISVRENIGAKLIRPLSEKEVKVVLDPTLLLTAEQWNQVAQNAISINGPYILVYMLLRDTIALQIAGFLQNMYQYPMIFIGNPYLTESSIQRDFCPGYDQLVLSGPETFVGLMKNAAFVVTNSFHGAAFSINYRKPFCVTPLPARRIQKSVDSRIRSLLESLRIPNRMMDRFHGHLADELLLKPDDKTMTLLQIKREESSSFLSKTIHGSFEHFHARKIS